jgi:hypothetical protein
VIGEGAVSPHFSLIALHLRSSFYDDASLTFITYSCFALARKMATGFEIVGVIMAVIPLVISALEHYEEGVSTIEKFFRYKREIRSIIESLSTENVMFKNSCEQLLSDFLSPFELADMLHDPRGETWKQPHIAAQLRTRLDRSYDVYMIHVGNMDSAIKKLVKKLDLDENGKVC